MEVARWCLTSGYTVHDPASLCVSNWC